MVTSGEPAVSIYFISTYYSGIYFIYNLFTLFIVYLLYYSNYYYCVVSNACIKVRRLMSWCFLVELWG